MKLTATILIVIGVALALYGWWGIFTKAGQRKYDEMDGFYPFFIGLGGLASILIAIILVVIVIWRSR
jgi:hypothetical protein